MLSHTPTNSRGQVARGTRERARWTQMAVRRAHVRAAGPPTRGRVLLRRAVVVLRAVNFAARLVQVVLEVASFACVETAAGPAVDTFFGANAGFVGLQLVELAAGQLFVLDAVPDSLRLPMLSRVDPRARMRRTVRGRGACRCGKRHRDESGSNVSTNHDVLLQAPALWRPFWKS